ncbi:type II toxin-antitoxin system CcdA family antitoxin [Pseudomonas sp. EA_105y_Pfl2_R69]|uniref:type II toxin-antitoxin system CcdA family antitoxin n=1 Tax=Pseudomonas sp. EA_105y_Pfl2_R69 TaxID=3088683 RepID=UPI0030DC0820
MSATDKPEAPREHLRLLVNGDLLDQASESGINLSSTLEQALAEVIKDKQQETWVAENREATAGYSEHVEEHGVFSDGLRDF